MKIDPRWVRPIVLGILGLGLLILLLIAKAWIEIVALFLLGLIPYLWGVVKPQGMNDRPKELRDSYSDAYDLSMMFLAATICGLYFVARSLSSVRHPMFPALLWSLACIIAGAGLGFLFGIPKVLSHRPAKTTKDQEAANPGNRGFAYEQTVNSNLEEISDWLTKIIVGLGLVELKNVSQYFRRAAGLIGASVGWPDTQGQGFGAGLIIFFGGVGFLGSYLLTRLFLAGAFFRAERDTNASALIVKEADRSALQQADPTSIAAIRESVKLGGSIESAVRENIPNANDEAAARVAASAFSELRTPTEFATWGKAQFNQKEFTDAVRAYGEAVRLAPEDLEIRLEYAVALYCENPDRPNREIQNQLFAAYHLIKPQIRKELVERTYTELLYNLLYDVANAGYEQAIRIGEEYVNNANYKPSSSIWLFLACAYGQQYRVLRSHDQALPGKLEWIKSRAAKCVLESIRLDPRESNLNLIEELLEGNGIDDDLKEFNDDEFRAAAGLT